MMKIVTDPMLGCPDLMQGAGSHALACWTTGSLCTCAPGMVQGFRV